MAMSIHHEPSGGYEEVAFTFIEQGIEGNIYEDQHIMQKKLSYYSNINPKSIYNKLSYQEKKFNEYLSNEICRKIPTFDENLCSLPSDRTLNSLYKTGSNNNKSKQNLYSSFLSEKCSSQQQQQNSEISRKRMMRKMRKRNFVNNVEKQHKTIQMPEENYKIIKCAQKGQLSSNLKNLEGGEYSQMQNSQQNSKKSQYYLKERSDAEIQQNGLLSWLENEIEEEKQDNSHQKCYKSEEQEKPKSSIQEEEDFYQKKNQRFKQKQKISSILSRVMEKIEQDSPNISEKSEKNDQNLNRKNSNQSDEQRNISMNSIEESKNE